MEPFLAQGAIFATCDSILAWHDSATYVWEGLPQGDPMSGLLFSTFMSLTLQRIEKDIGGECKLRSYVDDLVIAGPSVAMEEEVEDVLEGLLHAGLPPCKPKTLLLASHDIDEDLFPVLASFERVEDGMTICGHVLASSAHCDEIPFGTSGYVSQWIADKLEVERSEICKLLALQDPKHGPFGLQCSWAIFCALCTLLGFFTFSGSQS